MLLFAGAYMTVDLSLEAAAGEKKLWHCILASTVAGTVYGVAARSVLTGAALGLGVGAACAPGYYYLYVHRKEPSLLLHIAPRAAARREAAATHAGQAVAVDGTSQAQTALAEAQRTSSPALALTPATPPPSASGSDLK
jgi:hypothetical protein